MRGRKPGSALRDAAAPRDAPGQRGDADGLLTKLGALFQMRCPPWIEVDLSGWAQGQPPQETFETVKTAIFQRRVLSFCYFGSRGKSETRTARPIRLVFKSRDWYLYAFCLLRKDYRFFKLTRIRDLAMQEETFPPEPVPEKVAPSLRPERTVTVTSSSTGRQPSASTTNSPPPSPRTRRGTCMCRPSCRNTSGCIPTCSPSLIRWRCWPRPLCGKN